MEGAERTSSTPAPLHGGSCAALSAIFIHIVPLIRPFSSSGLTARIWITDIGFMAPSCEHTHTHRTLGQKCLFYGGLDWYSVVNYYSSSSLAAVPTRHERDRGRERDRDPSAGPSQRGRSLSGESIGRLSGCGGGASHRWPSDALGDFQDVHVC